MCRARIIRVLSFARRATLGPMAIFIFILAMLGASPVQAGYWTVPINYYDLEDIRYPLTDGYSDSTSYNNITNMSHAAQTSATYDAIGSWLQFVDDATRGRAVKMGGNEGFSFIKGAYPPGQRANYHGATSLSLWIKADDMKEGQFVAAGGDDRAGYSLTLQNGALVFTYWVAFEPTLIARDEMHSRDLGRVADSNSGWINVIITQYREDNNDSHPQYMALYVNGVLEASNDNALPASGLWFQFYPGIDGVFGYLGSAALKGYVYKPTSQTFESYARPFDNQNEELAGLQTYFGGLMSEFRLFANTEFVCSDKTRGGYATRNRAIEVGTRCDVASDVASISQDRIEPASILARMPFEQDPRDHHYEGLGKAAVAETHPPAPTYAPDEYRLYKAKFLNSGVRYTSDKLSKLDASYSVSFWIRKPAPALGNVYYLGDANSGFNILSRDGGVSLVLWRPTPLEPDGVCVVVGVDIPPGDGWRHLAFTVDPTPPSEIYAYQYSAAGVVAYLDGKRVQSKPLEKFVAAGPNVNVGGAGMGRDETCGKLTLPSYNGELSNLQVLKAPITAPQAAQLASRFANAAEAVYARRLLAFEAGTVSERNGYRIQATPPIELGHPVGDFGAIELEFTIDFGQGKLPPWVNPWTGASDPDCGYVLSGLEARNTTRNGPTDPVVALFCFSPEKIPQGLTPFAVSLFYPDRHDPEKINVKPISVLIWEPLASQNVLEGLSHYPRFGLNLKMVFRISISAYNMLVQAKTYGPDTEKPNFVSPIYQGAHGLVEAVFGKTDRNIALITPIKGLSDVKYFFIDQRQQLDDFDAKLSKGY